MEVLKVSKIDNNKEFLRLVAENPELPIIPMVNYEVCAGDYGYWYGSFGNSKIEKVVNYQLHSEDLLIEYDEKDRIFDAIQDYDVNENLTDDEIWEMVDNLNWKPAILVYIELS